jgi:hypothetical protein
MGSVRDFFPPLNTGFTMPCFHCCGTCPVAKLWLTTWLIEPARTSAQSFRNHTGIPSNPTAVVELSPWMIFEILPTFANVKVKGDLPGGHVDARVVSTG